MVCARFVVSDLSCRSRRGRLLPVRRARRRSRSSCCPRCWSGCAPRRRSTRSSSSSARIRSRPTPRRSSAPTGSSAPGSSLRCGLAALPDDAEAALVVLADGPTSTRAPSTASSRRGASTAATQSRPRTAGSPAPPGAARARRLAADPERGRPCARGPARGLRRPDPSRRRRCPPMNREVHGAPRRNRRVAWSSPGHSHSPPSRFEPSPSTPGAARRLAARARAPAPPADRRGDRAPRRHPPTRCAGSRKDGSTASRARTARSSRCVLTATALGIDHREALELAGPAGAAEAARVEPVAAAAAVGAIGAAVLARIARGRARAEPRAPRPSRPSTQDGRCRRRGRSRSSSSTAAATSPGRARSRAGSRRSRTASPTSERPPASTIRRRRSTTRRAARRSACAWRSSSTRRCSRSRAAPTRGASS